MNDERLRELLRCADADSAGPSAMPELAQRVRGLARRRRMVRAVGVVALIVVGAVVAMVQLNRPSAPLAQDPTIDPSVADQRLAVLQTEAEYHSALAERMWEAETQARRVARAERIVATVSPLRQIEREMDRAAMLAIQDADRMLRELNQHEEAAAEYRRTIELFPQSHWAAVAKNRLERIRGGKEG